MRDLVRARTSAVEALRTHRQQVNAFMLKHGRIYPGKRSWTMRYLRWLQEQHFDHPAHQIALQEMVEAVRIAQERVQRLETVIAEFLPRWSLAPVVGAPRALRGVDLIAAVTFATEVGDAGRFESPRQLMGYLGLVPGERSTGETTKRIGITKAGNSRVRTLLVECAWTYRYPPRIGKKKLYRLEEVSSSVREIAWKAQTRLTARYRMLSARGKKPTVIVHRSRTGTRRLHVGNCKGGATDHAITTGRARLAHWRRRDNGRGMSVNRFVAGMSDARSKTGTAPDAKSGMW